MRARSPLPSITVLLHFCIPSLVEEPAMELTSMTRIRDGEFVYHLITSQDKDTLETFERTPIVA